MKNKKLLIALATLTLGSATAAGLMFSACGHTHTYSEDWKYDDETGHYHVATCDDLHEGDEGYKIDLTPHNYGDDDICDDCGYKKVTTPDPEPGVTEYTITLNANGGTLADSNTVKTTNGKLTKLPDAPESSAPELTFKGWYTQATGGEAIALDKVYTADTTIYAQWRATDGIYTSAGKLIEALEWVDPSDSATKQYGGDGIDLTPGDTFVLKLEGEEITHTAGTLELWLAGGCHGVALDQSTHTFRVKTYNGETEARSFTIYAKYYTDGTPCWSIYITDGEQDALVTGGAYLVGSGWDDGTWDLAEENYIDPDNGLTVTLAANASFKVAGCKTPDEGSEENRDWIYNSASSYKMADGLKTVEEGYGYLNFTTINDGITVFAPGTYTITIDDSGKIVFTPAEGVEPVKLTATYVQDGYYLAGNFGAKQWDLNVNQYIDEAEGLTITLAKGAEFQAVVCKNAYVGGADWPYGGSTYYKMADGVADGYIDFSNNNMKVLTAGEYTITLDKTGEKPVFVITPAEGLQPDITEYTVTLNANGGTLEGTTTLETTNGKLSALPEAPESSAPELTFKGWYTQATGGEAITLDKFYTADTTIYAQWRATDGIYTSAGKLIEALEWVDPDDSATKQYGGDGIVLTPGDTFVLKLEGEEITHTAGTLELWLAGGCHGVALDQSTHTFRVKTYGGDTDPRSFTIYAKYYTNGTPCWSIYITDGEQDKLVTGGAYLVGSGWDDGTWDLAEENYIDPDNGLTVTLAANASFKVAGCKTPDEGSTENRDWIYNTASSYKMADGLKTVEEGYGYLNFTTINDGITVFAPGTYTITIDDSGKIVFTPAEGVDPVKLTATYVQGGYYLAGNFGAKQWDLNVNQYIDGDEGLTITLAKDAQFQAVVCKNAYVGGADWPYGESSYYRMADGFEEGYINLSGKGNKVVLTAGEYTITVDTSGEDPVFVITPAEGLQPDTSDSEDNSDASDGAED